MSIKSDYFFLNLKQVYPRFARPTALETEIWEEMLEDYSFEDIRAGIKAYRKYDTAGTPPTPAKFREYLYQHEPCEEKPCLPLSPEKHLMEEDIRAGRCRHFFPAYCRAVSHVLNVKLAELYPPEEFKSFSRGRRYRLAVDNGLFADFDRVLDIVDPREKKNG